MNQECCQNSLDCSGDHDHRHIYSPVKVRIAAITDETADVKTFRLEFVDACDLQKFKAEYRTGMFGEYGIFGQGESTFCIANPETRNDFIECTFRATGRVTSSLARADVGDVISFRGPYGNRFEVEKFEGKNLLFVAGGIALPPTRSVIETCLDNRDRYGRITIVYGAKTVDDLVYKEKLRAWGARGDVELVVTVDPGGETADWSGRVGFVPTVLSELAPTAVNSVAVICGPPIMIKFTLDALNKLGFDPDWVFTTLENRMKCGVGKCGRCNIGSTYVCKDGPVFSASQLAKLPAGDF